MMKTQTTVTLPCDVADQIRRILDYLWDHEARDYEDCDETERKNHMYRSIRHVDRWLSEQVDW